MPAGIFNRSIFNNDIFNTSYATKSGWYRIALEAWQRQSLEKYWDEQPKPIEPKPFKGDLTLKENKDGSVTVKELEAERKARRVRQIRKEKETERLPEFKLRPMYVDYTEPNYQALAQVALSDLVGMYRRFQPHVVRMQEKAANDEEDDFLILMLAA